MRKGLLFGVVALVLCACAKVEAPVEESRTVVFAGFSEDSETRSRIELGADGSVAQVLWTKGDSFRCLYSVSNNSGKIVQFTTQDDGVVSASFSAPNTVSGTGFHCIYPELTNWSTMDGSLIFGFNLPVVQTAVPGGIEEGLNRAYAYTERLTNSPDKPLQFKNLPSLLKFRLSGSVVPQVREITLSTTGVISGDVVVGVSGGVPSIVTGIAFSGKTSSSKIVLKGSFVAGKDYYIALWPGNLSGFQMEFSNGNGSYTVKRSRKAVTFERSRIKDIGTIKLGNAFEEQDDGNLDPVKYMSATEGRTPVTLAVIPEGFTKDELPKYERLAKSGIDALFDTEPFKTYRRRFNVYILKVASGESGASITDGNGNITQARDTHFGTRWGSDTYDDMRAEDSVVFDFVEEKCPDIVNGIHTLSEVPILMIVNDSRYGGRCWSWSNGQGFAIVPYVDNGDGLHWGYPNVVAATDDPLPTPVSNAVLKANYRPTTQADLDEIGGNNDGDWRNMLVHEFGGHCFGRLGDEYWPSDMVNYLSGPIESHTLWQVPFSLNLAYDPTKPMWQDLLDRLDELKARDARYGRIGVFQGAGNYTFGRWRSEKINCMIDNRFYFSAWQRYLITERIFILSGDSGSFSFGSWLAKDVTTDPVRDFKSYGAPGITERRSYRPVPPLPPPVLVDE